MNTTSESFEHVAWIAERVYRESKTHYHDEHANHSK